MFRQRGDTIIEVIMAVTIFSFVAVGTMTIMNKGVSAAQRSLEVTLVRQQLDAQAEMLRFVHDRAKEDVPSYVTLWQNVRTNVVSVPTQLLDVNACPASVPSGFVFIPTGAGNIAMTTAYNSSPMTYAKVDSGVAYGVSVQLANVTDGAAYDAYIQACWSSPGLARPMTIGTITRIYDAEA